MALLVLGKRPFAYSSEGPPTKKRSRPTSSLPPRSRCRRTGSGRPSLAQPVEQPGGVRGGGRRRASGTRGSGEARSLRGNAAIISWGVRRRSAKDTDSQDSQRSRSPARSAGRGLAEHALRLRRLSRRAEALGEAPRMRERSAAGLSDFASTAKAFAASPCRPARWWMRPSRYARRSRHRRRGRRSGISPAARGPSSDRAAARSRGRGRGRSPSWRR